MGTQQALTMEEIARHCDENDCWIILGEIGHEKVYDITRFMYLHPGGYEILMEVAGKNAQEAFENVQHSLAAKDRIQDFCIGKLAR